MFGDKVRKKVWNEILLLKNNSQRHMLFYDLFSLKVSILVSLRHHLGVDKDKD